MRFIEFVAAATSPADLAEILGETTRTMGYDYFALAHHVDLRGAPPSTIRLHNYPDRWVDYFDRNGLASADPIHRASQRTTVGFLWHWVPQMIPLTRQDLVNYAGVSGDLNPIHWDDEIAKQVGLDTAIAHGMLTMGLGGGYVTSWVGDPAAVTEYNVRFTAVVPVPNDGVGAEIVFNGRVKSIEPETKSVTIALSATTGGKKIFGRAVATAKLA